MVPRPKIEVFSQRLPNASYAKPNHRKEVSFLFDVPLLEIQACTHGHPVLLHIRSTIIN
jgi:hypothetical protein